VVLWPKSSRVPSKIRAIGRHSEMDRDASRAGPAGSPRFWAINVDGKRPRIGGAAQSSAAADSLLGLRRSASTVWVRCLSWLTLVHLCALRILPSLTHETLRLGRSSPFGMTLDGASGLLKRRCLIGSCDWRPGARNASEFLVPRGQSFTPLKGVPHDGNESLFDPLAALGDAGLFSARRGLRRGSECPAAQLRLTLHFGLRARGSMCFDGALRACTSGAVCPAVPHRRTNGHGSQLRHRDARGSDGRVSE
jgi:hypothetical protein